MPLANHPLPASRKTGSRRTRRRPGRHPHRRRPRGDGERHAEHERERRRRRGHLQAGRRREEDASAAEVLADLAKHHRGADLMARKTANVTISAAGRDQGKVFVLREMPASQAERWALVEQAVEAMAPDQQQDSAWIYWKAKALQAALALAGQLAGFPQQTMLADRASAYAQWDLPMADALHQEWERGKQCIANGLDGAVRFTEGAGRSGKFE